jgi:transposase InsO family protein
MPSRASAAPDLVERNFTAAEPNMLWVADLTYVKTLQGILYLAVVLDVFSQQSGGLADGGSDDHRLRSKSDPYGSRPNSKEQG